MQKISRRKFLAGSLAGAATLGGIYMCTRSSKESKLEIVSPLPLTFNNAVAHSQLRQPYLDKLFQNRFQENDEAWLSFAGFIYDEGLRNSATQAPSKPAYREDGFKVVSTPDSSELRGKPVCSYFSEIAFNLEYVASEEELKSVIDHESAHALMIHRSRVQFPIPPEAQDMSMLPDIIVRKIFETLAFEKQIFIYGWEKKRNVGIEFNRENWINYAQLNKELQQYALEHPEHGNIITPILNRLRVIPKKQ